MCSVENRQDRQDRWKQLKTVKNRQDRKHRYKQIETDRNSKKQLVTSNK